jgi:hypothetical protein
MHLLAMDLSCARRILVRVLRQFADDGSNALSWQWEAVFDQIHPKHQASSI